jgi:hypothetical protein
LIEIRFDAYIYAPYFLVLWHIIFEITAQIPEVEFGVKRRSEEELPEVTSPELEVT